eukprot:860921-Rhodomonas_salina.1
MSVPETVGGRERGKNVSHGTKVAYTISVQHIAQHTLSQYSTSHSICYLCTAHLSAYTISVLHI